jgi:hypothetical protein
VGMANARKLFHNSRGILVSVLQDQTVGRLERLQADFDVWLKRFNHLTPLSGFRP